MLDLAGCWTLSDESGAHVIDFDLPGDEMLHRIAQRPAVQRGRMVNRTWGQPSSQLHERHDAVDFETRTQDKLAASS